MSSRPSRAALARLDGVSFAHPSGPPLLHDVTLDVRQEILAVTGENGAGKSTLLDLLDGTLSPDAGRVHRPPLIARTPQDVDAPPPSPAAQLVDPALAARLGVDPEVLGRWPTASPGERRRWQIACALAREPDLLLLDEPTNHLDDDARAAVRALLRQRAPRTAIVIVSHDRALVDELAARTLLLHRGRALVVDGGWREAWAAHELAQRAAQDARARAHEVAREARRHVADARRREGDADKQRSTRTRMKSKYDSDQRGLLANYRSETAAARMGKDVARAKSELARAEASLEQAPVVDKAFGAELALASAPLGRPWLCVLPELGVRRDARLRIQGQNGAGKTTLLRRVHEAARGDAFFLPQDLTADEERAALASFHALPRDVRGRAGELLAALGVDPAKLAASQRPSCGEAKKLLLARALALHTAALLLDEPTNHLDLPSVERLARALASFRGALVIVTHDDAFAEAAQLAEAVALPARS